MHLALTDRLSCPRCGPEFGLILLAEEVRDHRVLAGDLGCPNCRERYPIRRGFGDFRMPPEPSLPRGERAGNRSPPDADETVRMGALLGVTDGPGTILLRGEAAGHAGNLARLIGGIEVVAVDESLAAEEESEGVSRIAAGGRLPFFTGTFLGVLSSPGEEMGLWEELARVLAPGGRFVIMNPDAEDACRVRALGFQVLLEEERGLVVRREGAEPPPLITLRGL